MGAPGLDFETWESMKLKVRMHALRDLAALRLLVARKRTRRQSCVQPLEHLPTPVALK